MAVKTAIGTYEVSAQEIAELYADYVEHESAAPALVLSSTRASEAVRDALAKTLVSFDFESPTCTFATLTPRDSSAEGGNIALDPQALFILVEGLDPLFVIATDIKATETLGEAYHMQLASNAPARIFGRPAAVFSNLDEALGSDEGKQKAWRVLKTLKA